MAFTYAYDPLMQQLPGPCPSRAQGGQYAAVQLPIVSVLKRECMQAGSRLVAFSLAAAVALAPGVCTVICLPWIYAAPATWLTSPDSTTVVSLGTSGDPPAHQSDPERRSDLAVLAETDTNLAGAPAVMLKGSLIFPM